MKRLILLSITSFYITCIFSQIPTYVPTNGLVGWWPFNGNANDESGNSHHGTVNGAILTADRFGNPNSAYSFNGINTEIRVPNSTSLNLIGDFSISIWYKSVNPPTNNNSHTLIAKRDDNLSCCSPNVPWDFQINYQQDIANYKKPLCAFANGSYTFAQADSLITINTWQHLVFIYGSDTLKMYLNNTKIYSNYFSPSLRASNTSDMLIGSINRASGDEYMNGALDEIGIWNRALTQQEITTLYNRPNCSAIITLNGPSSFCSGQTQNIKLSVDSSGLIYKQYLWSTGDTTPSILVNPTQTTKYKVTVVQNGESCKDSITITVNAKPTVAPAATPATICQGQSSALVANATAGSGTISSYSWSSGLVGNVSGGSVSPSSTTTYTVTVTNSNSCSSSASATVIVNAKPVVSPTSTPATICQGQSSTLAANATAGSGTISSYSWSSGLVGNVSGGSVSPAGTTTYTVTVRNSNSCSASASVIVNVNPLPVVSINSFPAFVNINAAPVTLSGTPVGGTFNGPGVAGTSFYPSSAGLGRKQVTYSFTNGNGCSNSANSSTIVYDTIVCHVSVTDTLIINTVLTGISPPNNLNTIKIYPNPASDHLNINTGNYSLMNGYTIKIINPLSQVVFQNLINQALFNISLSGWSHGSYIIQILDATSNIIETKVLVLQ